MRSPRTTRSISEPLELLKLLSQGGLLLIPTDTLFGLAVRADYGPACERLASLKGRDPAKPLPIVFRDLSQLRAWCPESAGFFPLIEALLPGALTLVLPGSARLGQVRAEWGHSVGVRLPGVSPSSALLAQLPWPLAVSSANFSGAPDPRSASELEPAILANVDAVLPGDPALGQASTVLDLRCDPPRILRQGYISREDLRPTMGDLL